MEETTSSGAMDSGQLDNLVASFQQEKAALADQRKELAILIKQAVSEIDRLSQRNRDLTSQMRQLQANIDSFSRAEIQQLYSAYQEAQMRLFMMQSQLEQLRSRQTNLERTEQLLNSLLEASNFLRGGGAARGTLTGVDGAASIGGGDAANQPIPSIELAYHRISRELQDGPAQALSDLILRAEVGERLVQVDWQKAKTEMASLRQAATSALKSTRQLVHELQPPALEELGLAIALRRYVEVSRPSERLQIELQIAGQERRLPTSVELAVFRIIQEALTNAARHSGASRAEVKLRFEAEQLVATIADEGRGFDVGPAMAEATLKEHSGLADMQLRARLIGGNLEISSKVGGGCMISLAVSA
ncbi:MAG: sensor histidine kinase [Chloroflexota bacterium]